MSLRFLAGTLVHTDRGLVPIQNLQVGDWVLSSKEIGKSEFQPILKINRMESKQIFEIILKSYIPPTESHHDFCGHNFIDILYYGENTSIYINSNAKKKWKNAGIKFASEGFYIKPKYSSQEAPIIVKIENLYDWKNFGVGLEVDEFPYLTFVKFFNEDYKTFIANEGNFSGYDDEMFELDNHFKNFDENSENANILREFRERSTLLQEPILSTLYQIEVKDMHSYFVGEQGLWVGDNTI